MANAVNRRHKENCRVNPDARIDNRQQSIIQDRIIILIPNVITHPIPINLKTVASNSYYYKKLLHFQFREIYRELFWYSSSEKFRYIHEDPYSRFEQDCTSSYSVLEIYLNNSLQIVSDDPPRCYRSFLGLFYSFSLKFRWFFANTTLAKCRCLTEVFLNPYFGTTKLREKISFEYWMLWYKYLSSTSKIFRNNKILIFTWLAFVIPSQYFMPM